jgi:hypothetical protein
MAGWPTDADLADELGLAVAGAFSDDTRITSANAAAIADATNTLEMADPSAPDLDDGQFKAVLGLGVWWYEVRNRPEGLDSLNPVASPYQRRTMLQILARGKLAVG